MTNKRCKSRFFCLVDWTLLLLSGVGISPQLKKTRVLRQEIIVLSYNLTITIVTRAKALVNITKFIITTLHQKFIVLSSNQHFDFSHQYSSNLGLADFIYMLQCWELELGHHSRNLGRMGLLDLLVCWADIFGFVGKWGWVNGSYTRTRCTRWVQFTYRWIQNVTHTQLL
jgi:hypothetical protein